MLCVRERERGRERERAREREKLNVLMCAQARGVDVIVSALRRHRSHARVQEEGCRALLSLMDTPIVSVVGKCLIHICLLLAAASMTVGLCL